MIQLQEKIYSALEQGICPDGFYENLTSVEQKWWNDFNLINFIPANDWEEIHLQSHGHNYIKDSKNIRKANFEIEDSTFLKKAFQYQVLKNNLEWNYLKPFCSFTTIIAGQKVRLSLIHESCHSKNICKGFIRNLSKREFLIEDFIDSPLLNLFTSIVNDKKNALIVGPTGCGKTSLLTSTLNMINTHEHLIILEDTKEIDCNVKNQTSLISSSEKGKELKDLVTYAMRMSPERIVLGEIRSKEVISFLLAINSGHRGCWSTLHANSAPDAIDRLALLFSIFSETNIDLNTIKKLVCNAIDYIIYIENKKIQSINKIISFHDDLIYEKYDLEFTSLVSYN